MYRDPTKTPATPMLTGRPSRRHPTAEAHYAARGRYQAEHGPDARRRKAEDRRSAVLEATDYRHLTRRAQYLAAYRQRRAEDADWQRLVVNRVTSARQGA